MSRLIRLVPRTAWRAACAAALICALGAGAGARAQDDPTLQPVPASGYQPIAGQPFFLLTDASYGSDETAKVRLEAPDDGELQRYGGADVLVYRIADPLAFLKGQKNLHRIEVQPNWRGEGLANTLAYLWDSWYRQARRSWQRILSYDARRKAVAHAPQLAEGAAMTGPTRFADEPQFEPLKGYPLLERFRYPLWQAKPIQPPRDVAMAGSSSNFLPNEDGNVMIPVGRLKPGLYLVEAVIGGWRANTLLFVTDTVAITKSTRDGMLAWTADRRSGAPVAGAELSWTDGLGVLRSGATGADGVLALDHASPEHSYLIGRDRAGGVFISENYYYDSEIYNTKLYAFTDRPLYRPGDTVHVKFVGRDFHGATDSSPAAAGPIDLEVLDPNGAPVAHAEATLSPRTGADASFALPANAAAGGYTLRFDYGGDRYGSAFRVAEYVKPHFNVALVMDKNDYGTGEPLDGHLQLNYTDGRPVAGAHVSVSVRAQQVSMVEGELRYAGLFPIKLDQQELVAGADGSVPLHLPPAKDPSRYVVTVLASDGAAWRVRVTRELLVARGATPYRLDAPSSFTQPGQPVAFTLTPQPPVVPDATAPAAAVPAQPPTQWTLTRLEDQSTLQGALPGARADAPLTFTVTPPRPGSYTLSVKDAHDNLLAAASHWVAGEGVSATPGSVRIVLDKRRYAVGDTAQALITFPAPVADALLTLERDKVERHALLSGGGDWLHLTKLSPTQYRASIPIDAAFSPNMTFSVLYVKDGDYAFQNAGIAVAQPQVALAVHADKAVYAPGDTVDLDFASTLDGKPVAANLTVSVVDEMVYVLQPEIAPNIVDFFYHPRRDSVRTSSSLNFISYDMALSALPGAPPQSRYNERGVKVLERPRRDEQDTAVWVADLPTDAAGHAHLRFAMPDSLTRWRITVRAATPAGVVGQATADVRSDKPLYLKWTGPTHFRAGDKPQLDLVAFNQGTRDVDATLEVQGAGLALSRPVVLHRGPNVLRLPADHLAGGMATARLVEHGATADSLQTRLVVEPDGWPSPRQLSLPLAGSGPLALALPADARDLRLRFAGGADSQLARIADELADYPYGCVEQTSSRLIPLALAASGYAQGDTTSGIDGRLRTERQRLALLAGQGGVFGWWGDGSGGDPFLTAYAYYADWLASRVLKLDLPADNWKQVLLSYRDSGDQPALRRALELYWAQQMGLPVATPLDGLAEALAPGGQPAALDRADSVIFAAPDSSEGNRLAIVLVAQTYRDLGRRMPAALAAQLPDARATLAGDDDPFVQSLLLLGADRPDPARAAALLARIGPDMPTMERAIALTWLQRALGGRPGAPAPDLSPADVGPGHWLPSRSPTGQREWRWDGAAPPGQLVLAGQRGDGAAPVAVLDYRSRAREAAQLPVRLERRLYKLVAQAPAVNSSGDVENAEGRTYAAVAVAPGEAIDANALYVDEVVLTPDGGTYRYGLLEVPLPPGGSVEASTWGLTITGLPGEDKGGNGNVPRAPVRQVQHEMGELSYHQPVAALDHRQVYRQLVRFALPGTFALPPARFFRMYQPEAKALQGDGRGAFTLTVK
jgi:uncharacterized protein YfaS (alpha-2-macroglobulin family)